MNWIQAMLAGDRDKQATAVGATSAVAALSTIDTSQLASGDKAEMLKVIFALGMWGMGFLANRKEKKTPPTPNPTPNPAPGPAAGRR